MAVTNYIVKYADEANGVKAVVNLTPSGFFAVTVTDTDADAAVGTKWFPTLAAADAYAQACVR
jgi:hypothetical protein